MAWVENGKVGIESKSKMTTLVNYGTIEQYKNNSPGGRKTELSKKTLPDRNRRRLRYQTKTIGVDGGLIHGIHRSARKLTRKDFE